MNMVEENLFDTPEPKRRYSPSMYFPVFDPAVDGKQHQLHELVNTRRYKEASRMVAEAFDSGKITDEEREFLDLAATRFVEFNFTAIAEQYCVSSPAARELFEKLCLVYVSTTKAIMNTLVECDNAFREYVDKATKYFDQQAAQDSAPVDEPVKPSESTETAETTPETAMQAEIEPSPETAMNVKDAGDGEAVKEPEASADAPTEEGA